MIAAPRASTRRLALLGLSVWLVAPVSARATEKSTPDPAVPTPAASPPAASPPVVPVMTLEAVMQEATRLQDAMVKEVPRLVARTPASDAEWIALAQAEIAAAKLPVDRPQLLVVVDRNPRVQQLAVMLAAPGNDWRVIGGARVSTGSMGRFDHYVTPRGVFRVTDAILGFRAEGTLNENGIRGLGAKGMRVWDFGWHVALKGWKADIGKPDRTPIRLMMHATDPDRLEQRLGQPASQGCVRIPTAMNRFLDRHGVLDAEYERAAITDIRFRALLMPGRQPSTLSGNTMVVVDSAERPATSVNVASHAPAR